MVELKHLKHPSSRGEPDPRRTQNLQECQVVPTRRIMDRAQRDARPSRQHQSKHESQVGSWGITVGQRPEGSSIKMPGMELKQVESRKDKMEVGQRKYVWEKKMRSNRWAGTQEETGTGTERVKGKEAATREVVG